MCVYFMCACPMTTKFKNNEVVDVSSEIKYNYNNNVQRFFYTVFVVDTPQ